MEILTFILEGALEHKDSMGNGSVIHAGEVQRMSAGTGVTHSEFNPSKTNSTHLFQVWILPKEKGLAPCYEQKKFSNEEKTNRLLLVASGDGRGGSVSFNQDVDVYTSLMEPETKIEAKLDKKRFGWIQVAQGMIHLNGTTLMAGDGAAISDEESLQLKAEEFSEFLFFDIA